MQTTSNFRRRWARSAAAAAMILAGATAATASTVVVRDAQLRAPRAGFAATVAAMSVTSPVDAEIVRVSTPLAQAVRLQTMRRSGDTVEMVDVGPIALPAGREVRLRTGVGSQHLMVERFARPLRGGERLMFTLWVRDAGAAAARPIRVPVVVHARPHQDAQEEHLH